MSIFGIIIICCIILFAAIGGLVGAFKGFTKVQSWGFEYILTLLIGVPVAGLITKKLASGNATLAGFLALGITLLLIVLFMSAFIVLRKVFTKQIEKKKQLYYYEHYIEIEQANMQILGAVTVKDKKEYKRLTKLKNKRKAGVWGILDRVFGGVVLGFKGAVIVGLIAAILLCVIDFTRLANEGHMLYGMFGKIYSSGGWKFFKGVILDCLVVLIILLCVNNGYNNGISSALWTVLVIGMVVGIAVLAWYFAFKVDEFIAVAVKLDNNLGSKLSSVASILEKIGMTTLTISKAIVAVIMFLLMLVAVILFAVFVPRLIDSARGSTVFCIVDGVFGAILFTVFILALLLVVGAVANSMHDLQIMNVFNAYFDKSKLATYFYDNNLLQAMGALNNLPTKKWLS